jgi:uncharacterized protein YecE (DUF72 family)
VEIDQWFWSLFGLDKVSLPQEKTVKQYASSVPEEFRFTIKVPNSVTLTHFYKKHKTDPLEENPYFLSEDLFGQFLKSLEPMHSKIGMLMFQFEYLNKQKMDSLTVFLDMMNDFFGAVSSQFPYGLEIRNPQWLNRAYFNFLKEKKIGHVFLQGYYMPDIWQSYYRFWSLIDQTTVIRLHGPSRSDIEEKSGGIWNQIYEPKDDELSRLNKMIEEMQSKNLDIYINVNNHYEGSAPLTIEKIRQSLGLK